MLDSRVFIGLATLRLTFEPTIHRAKVYSISQLPVSSHRLVMLLELLWAAKLIINSSTQTDNYHAVCFCCSLEQVSCVIKFDDIAGFKFYLIGLAAMSKTVNRVKHDFACSTTVNSFSMNLWTPRMTASLLHCGTFSRSQSQSSFNLLIDSSMKADAFRNVIQLTLSTSDNPIEIAK